MRARQEAKLNSRVGVARSWAFFVGWFVFAFTSVPLSAALLQEPASTAPLLALEEGQAVVQTAWEQRERVQGTPDCSHLVHEIYQLAGLFYPYATSFALYEGSESFARVETPQPGDLIAWPGHVGIVVDPVERSFYSSLDSGLGTDSYASSYWAKRGPARFYRYRLRSARSPAAATAPPASLPGRTRTESAASRPAFEVPPSIPIVTQRAQPTREAIAEAISELSNAAGDILRSDDLMKLPYPVVIFDRFRVERVQIKKDRGWAHLRIESSVSFRGERIEPKRRREKLRWELRRRGTEWFAFPPLERVYVPRDVAVRVLADQLALLTRQEVSLSDSDVRARQQAHLASLLYALLVKK